MSNTATQFVTCNVNALPYHGSSLYVVDAEYVYRCSANRRDGRTPTTFIRKRAIKYLKHSDQGAAVGLPDPELGREPMEGEHRGNEIVEILTPQQLAGATTPKGWREAGGKSWQVAQAEIAAAQLHVQNHPNTTRAKREIGLTTFVND